MWKRFMLLCCLTALLLTACNAGSSQTEDVAEEEAGPSLTLNLVIGAEEAAADWWYDLIDAFGDSHPDIEVNLTIVAEDAVDATVQKLVEEGNPPDLSNAALTESNVEAGVYVPAAEYVSDTIRSDILAGSWTSVSIQGTGWGLPLLADCYGLYYSEEILETVGIALSEDWTSWKDAFQAILDYYGYEVYPLGLNLSAEEGGFTAPTFIYNNGSDLLDGSDWALNSQGNINTLLWLVGVINWGYTNYDLAGDGFAELLELYADEELAMFIGPYTLLGELDALEIAYAVGQIPADDGLVSYALGEATVLTVFAANEAEDAEEPEDAEPEDTEQDEAEDDAEEDEAEDAETLRLAALSELLDYIYEADRYAALAEAAGLLPVTTSAVAEMVADGILDASWQTLLSSCRFLPTWKDDWSAVSDGLVEVLQEAVHNDASVADGLDALQQTVE